MATTKTMDPDGREPWLWDWDAYLEAGDTIESYEFEVDDELSLVATASTQRTVTGWIEPTDDAEIGHVYEATNHIVSQFGVEDDWTLKLRIRQQ